MIEDLIGLIERAANGEVIGVGYSILTSNQDIQVGTAGCLATNRIAAASAFFMAAVDTANTVQREIGNATGR